MTETLINEKQLEKILKQILSVDKTPEYEYYSEDDNTNYLNGNEIAPKTGSRWCTPKEICCEYLRDINAGKLENSLKVLMGDD